MDGGEGRKRKLTLPPKAGKLAARPSSTQDRPPAVQGKGCGWQPQAGEGSQACSSWVAGFVAEVNSAAAESLQDLDQPASALQADTGQADAEASQPLVFVSQQHICEAVAQPGGSGVTVRLGSLRATSGGALHYAAAGAPAVLALAGPPAPVQVLAAASALDSTSGLWQSWLLVRQGARLHLACLDDPPAARLRPLATLEHPQVANLWRGLCKLVSGPAAACGLPGGGLLLLRRTCTAHQARPAGGGAAQAAWQAELWHLAGASQPLALLDCSPGDGSVTALVPSHELQLAPGLLQIPAQQRSQPAQATWQPLPLPDTVAACCMPAPPSTAAAALLAGSEAAAGLALASAHGRLALLLPRQGRHDDPQPAAGAGRGALPAGWLRQGAAGHKEGELPPGTAACAWLPQAAHELAYVADSHGAGLLLARTGDQQASAFLVDGASLQPYCDAQGCTALVPAPCGPPASGGQVPRGDSRLAAMLLLRRQAQHAAGGPAGLVPVHGLAAPALAVMRPPSVDEEQEQRGPPGAGLQHLVSGLQQRLDAGCEELERAESAYEVRLHLIRSSRLLLARHCRATWARQGRQPVSELTSGVEVDRLAASCQASGWLVQATLRTGQADMWVGHLVLALSRGQLLAASTAAGRSGAGARLHLAAHAPVQSLLPHGGWPGADCAAGRLDVHVFAILSGNSSSGSSRPGEAAGSQDTGSLPCDEAHFLGTLSPDWMQLLQASLGPQASPDAAAGQVHAGLPVGQAGGPRMARVQPGTGSPSTGSGPPGRQSGPGGSVVPAASLPHRLELLVSGVTEPLDQLARHLTTRLGLQPCLHHPGGRALCLAAGRRDPPGAAALAVELQVRPQGGRRAEVALAASSGPGLALLRRCLPGALGPGTTVQASPVAEGHLQRVWAASTALADLLDAGIAAIEAELARRRHTAQVGSSSVHAASAAAEAAACRLSDMHIRTDGLVAEACAD